MEVSVNQEMQAEAAVLPKPKAGGSVWPGNCCPAFILRNMGLGGMKGCWFCRYADFHLHTRVALEVGVCCWPQEQIH